MKRIDWTLFTIWGVAVLLLTLLIVVDQPVNGGCDPVDNNGYHRPCRILVSQ